MSDSDSELLTTYQDEIIVSAHGPGINVNGMRFSGNNSMMNKPRNYEWRRPAGSSYDQRSLGYQRETSPMSIASAYDARRRNFNGSYYGKEPISQRSVYNDRAGSPMSMRSMDSNATICATDIAMAFKNMQFNSNDTMIIKEAYNRFMKQKSTRRRRIEKRRNQRLVKHMRSYNRRKSGYDSGELGSNSSISSDDDQSIRTSNYKSTKSSYKATLTDISDFRRTIKESNFFQDRSDNLRQNKMQNMAEVPAYLNSSRALVTTRSVIEKPTFTKSMPTINVYRTLNQMETQKERFKNGFLLPSQRFNKSVATTSIPEEAEKPHLIRKNTHFDRNKESCNLRQITQIDPSSEDEEIFTEKTMYNQTKRGIDIDDIVFPSQKKPKVLSPCKNMTSFRSATIIEAKNDFKFAKPALPVNKAANLKAKDKLISEIVIHNPTDNLISSSRPISDTIGSSVPKQAITILQPEDIEKKEDTECNTLASQNISDLSMRPSFIKRKLFSQNMDVTEKTLDIANSPQNSIYGTIQKEKNKARKLATSKYCLSRDIQTDESNLLDLIHKIVPAEQMNATNQTTKTIQNKSQDDKWDISSVISASNNQDNMSDTYTDEDTLNPDHGEQIPSPAVHETFKLPPNKDVENKSVTKNVVANTDAKSVAISVVKNKCGKSPIKVTQVTHKVLAENNGTTTNAVSKCVKSFWDTDFESDAEGPMARKNESKENTKSEAYYNMGQKAGFKGFPSMFPLNKTTAANNTTMFNNTVDKFSITSSLKLCSHRNAKPYSKKAENLNDIRSHFEPQIKKNQFTTKTTSCIDLTLQSNDKQNKIKQQKNQKLVTKELTPQKRKINKEKSGKSATVTIVKEPVKSQKKVITKENSCIDLSMHDNVEENKTKQLENKNPTPKKLKTNKESNDKISEVTTGKKLTKPQKETLKVDENPKLQNDTTTHTIKLQDKKDNKNAQRYKPKTNKKLATAQVERQKVKEDETHKSKTQSNKNTQIPENNKDTVTSKSRTNNNSTKNHNTKAEYKQLTSTANKAEKTKNIIKNPIIILSDVIVNKDTFTEQYNSSLIRPLRSCRISKLNETRRNLRSSLVINDIKKNNLPTKQSTQITKNVAQAKPAHNKLVNNQQQNLEDSDVSFSITQDCLPTKRNNKHYNTRLQSSIESNISLSLNDTNGQVRSMANRR